MTCLIDFSFMNKCFCIIYISLILGRWNTCLICNLLVVGDRQRYRRHATQVHALPLQNTDTGGPPDHRQLRATQDRVLAAHSGARPGHGAERRAGVQDHGWQPDDVLPYGQEHWRNISNQRD